MSRLLRQQHILFWVTVTMLVTVVVFLFPSHVRATQDCCLQITQVAQTTYQEDGIIFDTEVDGTRTYETTSGNEQITGCRPRPAGAECAEERYGSDFDCSTDYNIGANVKSCSVNEISERKVDCTAYPACQDVLKTLTSCDNLSASSCRQANGCFWDGVRCLNKYDTGICSQLRNADLCGESQACEWNKTLRACITKVEATLSGNRTNRSDILPDCAVTGTCRNLNDLVETAIKVARKLFGLFGSFAFVMFIYGGVRMIASFGNPEQFQKGKSILSAAVVGIIIAFGAFLLIGYVLSALGVDSDLRAGVTLEEPETTP